MSAPPIRARPAVDPFDVRRAQRPPPALAAFDAAGILAPAEVHAAVALDRAAGDGEEATLLAAALAVRAPRLGSVCVDLATVADTVVPELHPGGHVGEDGPGAVELGWPEPAAWLEALRASPLVWVVGAAGSSGDAGVDDHVATGGVSGGDVAPLVLHGSRIYLDRYWRYEQAVVAALRRRASATVDDVDLDRARDRLERRFPSSVASDGPDRQRLAAATAVLRKLTVVAGGPGTGKTTTVAGILALLADLADLADLDDLDDLDVEPPRIALAAPTGKAAARLTAAVRDAVHERLELTPSARRRLGGLEATTLHRLLGSRPGSRTRFRHDHDDPLPHDLVVVDETSMVSLALVAHLLDAVRPEARLVLLGDPGQLASVEAGSVLGDLVGPSDGLPASSAARERLTAVTGERLPAPDPQRERRERAGGGVADAIVELRRVHRFEEGSGIAALAAAVRAGDLDATLAVLEAGRADVAWLAADEPSELEHLAALRAPVVDAATTVIEAARAGEASTALAHVEDLRVLCAHRRGPFGVAAWGARIERWLAGAIGAGGPRQHVGRSDRWYPGRPVLLTRNDHRLGLFNGDVGVCVAGRDADGEGTTVAFAAADGGIRRLSPGRLGDVETVHAMTIHRSQGSQYDHAVVVLPGPDSPILTRQLLYTAVTRARRRVTVVGSRESVAAAVSRRVARASGLGEALWGASDDAAK